MNAPTGKLHGIYRTALNRRWPGHLAVLGAYTLLALAFSYPLVLRLADSIPGVQGDVWSYLWAMGWARTATFDLGINPFRSDYVFYPLGGATQLLWATALPSFASVPLQLAIGLVPAFNVMYLAATVLTAYGTYLLARYVLDHPPHPPLSKGGMGGSGSALAAFVAGAAFAFSALRLGYGVAFTNLFHTELIPFYILYLLKTRYELKWRNAVAAGFLLGLNVYIDFQIAAFLILFTALLAVAAVVEWIREQRGQLTYFFGRLAIAGIVSLLVAAPMIAIVADDLTTEGSNYIRVYPLKYSSARSYDALSYLLPNARSSLYQMLPTPQVAGVNAKVNVEGESQLSPDRQAFLGLLVLALAVLGAAGRPRALALWIVAALVFAVLSFGPTLHLAGTDLEIPLPYAFLHELPIINNIRIPMRYGVMTFLSVAILAAAGISWLSTRVRPAPLAAVAAALILGEAAVFPYPTLTLSVPHVYDTIAAQPGDFTVLEIPTFNWRAAAANEVFQVFHHKRILRAYTNRIAPDLADYFSLRQTPIVVRTLRVLEGAEDGPIMDDELAADRAAAPAEIQFFNLRYAVLHREWLDPASASRIDQYLRDVLGARFIAQEGTVWAYELPQSQLANSNHAMSVQSDSALMYLGRGWQTEPLAQIAGETGRFVTGNESELYLQVSNCDCSAPHLLFRTYSQKGNDVLQFILNGQNVATAPLIQGWADYDLTLTPGWVQGGSEKIRVLHSTPQENEIAFSRFEIR